MKRTVLSLLLLALLFLPGCSADKKRAYYVQKENYIQVEGTVSWIKYNEDQSALYLGFCELSPSLDDDCLKITGKNLEIVKNNGIDKKCKIGQKVLFQTAPRIFGDGYVMPIVALFINGECLLSFEEGYTGWMDWIA